MTKIRVRDVVQATSIVMGVPRKQILGSHRHRNVVRARQISMIMARRLTDRSLLDVGHQMGRDHSTVLHAIREHSDKVSPQQAAAIAEHARRLADQFWSSFKGEV
jgi:chromosomal replication initiation ATPase DnaA